MWSRKPIKMFHLCVEERHNNLPRTRTINFRTVGLIWEVAVKERVLHSFDKYLVSPSQAAISGSRHPRLTWHLYVIMWMIFRWHFKNVLCFKGFSNKVLKKTVRDQEGYFIKENNHLIFSQLQNSLRFWIKFVKLKIVETSFRKCVHLRAGSIAGPYNELDQKQWNFPNQLSSFLSLGLRGLCFCSSLCTCIILFLPFWSPVFSASVWDPTSHHSLAQTFSWIWPTSQNPHSRFWEKKIGLAQPGLGVPSLVQSVLTMKERLANQDMP